MPAFYPEYNSSPFGLEPAFARFVSNGVEYVVPAANSVIRRFSQGGGRFDHLIHREGEGFLIILAGDQEALDYFDELEERGFPVEAFQEPDNKTLRIILETEISVITSGSKLPDS
ncbi:hypothetical protein HYW35_04380 [Candidatus Saccharibacteria bacterium]|nr:hypothetical protein [Candidatus Saccharibacteria bacterium]